MQYIDIHGHYAWDIDDGIETKEDAIEALRIAKDEHMNSIVATPHMIPGRHSENDIENIRERIKELKAEGEKLNIRVYEGCELFLNQDTLEALDKNIFIPIGNTRYLLCEFDVRQELSDDERDVEDLLYEIDIRGYIPIIGHVERYFKGKIDIDRIKEWKDSGYVIQVNSTSLLGLHGKTCQKNAYTLIDNGLADVIASDTHRSHGHRIPNLNRISQLLSKKYDYDIVKILLCNNPQHIINDEETENIKIKKSLMKKIFGR